MTQRDSVSDEPLDVLEQLMYIWGPDVGSQLYFLQRFLLRTVTFLVKVNGRACNGPTVLLYSGIPLRIQFIVQTNCWKSPAVSGVCIARRPSTRRGLWVILLAVVTFPHHFALRVTISNFPGLRIKFRSCHSTRSLSMMNLCWSKSGGVK